MSAGLQNYDWMFSVKERPWHGIGDVIEDAPNSQEAIKIAKLDWKVVQYPVSANGNIIPDTFANVRSDTNESLGVVKDRYTILQNDEAFSFVDDIINNREVECKYETAGSLFNGRRVFMLVRLPDVKLVGDDVENYMFFTNSHDGSSKMMAGISNIRVVCNNTLQLAMKNAKRTWFCRHTQGVKDKVEEAKQSLGLAIQYIDSVKDIADKMATTKMNKDQFFEKLVVHPKIVNCSDSYKGKIIERIDAIYENTNDLDNFKGTTWGLYNAVADYVSNAKPLRETENFKSARLDRFFDGERLLNCSQDILLAA